MPKPKKQKVVRSNVKQAIKLIEGRGSYRPRAAPRNIKRPAGIPRVGGKGGFWSDMWSGVKSGVKQVADFAPKAMTIYKTIAPLLSGFGAYKVKSNSFLHGSNMESGFATNQAPSFSSAGVGSDIIFSHREFVTDIKSSIAFRNNTFILNPGNPQLFPWLSQIASLYEEYQFLGVVVEYKSSSATAVGTTSSAMGSVIMATDYDCLDENYANKRAMEAAEYSCSGTPFESFIHPIECDPKRNPIPRLYVVPSITKVSQAPGDPRFSIHGICSVATVGQQQDNTNIGELWISYHVRLSRPILESAAASAPFSQHIAGRVSPSGLAVDTVIDSNRTVGDPFAISFSGNYGGMYASITTSANSPNVGGTYMVSVRAITDTAVNFAVPANINQYFWNIGTTTFPNVATSASLVHDLVHLSSASSGPSTITPYNVFLINGMVTINAGLDGWNVYMPTLVGANVSFDIYITPFNMSYAPVSTRFRGASKIELSSLMSRLQQLELRESASQATTSRQLASSSTFVSDASDSASAAAAAASPFAPQAADVAHETREWPKTAGFVPSLADPDEEDSEYASYVQWKNTVRNDKTTHK